jgi:hypothetical protein
VRSADLAGRLLPAEKANTLFINGAAVDAHPAPRLLHLVR